MWKYNGKTIRVGRSWTDDSGVTHPSVWNRWTPEFKESVGLVWEADPVVEPYDDRFYWSANNPRNLEDVSVTDEEGSPVLDESGNQRVQKGLKTQWIERTKQTANSLLSPTDWYVVRESETATAIPTEVKAYRAAVRTASGTIESAVSACTTLDEFIALFQAPIDAEGNATGNAPIHDWPELV